jgi:hypothetical protein
MQCFEAWKLLRETGCALGRVHNVIRLRRCCIDPLRPHALRGIPEQISGWLKQRYPDDESTAKPRAARLERKYKRAIAAIPAEEGGLSSYSQSDLDEIALRLKSTAAKKRWDFKLRRISLALMHTTLNGFIDGGAEDSPRWFPLEICARAQTAASCRVVLPVKSNPVLHWSTPLDGSHRHFLLPSTPLTMLPYSS